MCSYHMLQSFYPTETSNVIYKSYRATTWIIISFVHTFIGPFLRHPTPNNDCPLLRVSSKLIFVAVSINAAAAVTVGILFGHR